MTGTVPIPEVIDVERNPWLAQVAAPLADTPCGEDPRDSDAFFLLRQEIDKRQDNQYERVQELGRQLLGDATKDLRVAGYLIMAAVYTRGLVGLAETVRAYRIIAEQFWDDCHPQKENTRRLALEWLNSAKLARLIRNHAVDKDPVLVDAVAADVAAINACMRRQWDGNAPEWTTLNEWLAAQQRNRPTQAAADGTVAPTAAPGSGPGVHIIDSDRSVRAATQAIRAYLLEHGESLQAAAYARALRWSRVTLPTAGADGRTPIAPPRASALADIHAAAAAAQWAHVGTLCEEVFLEPGGPFLLDLQRWAVEAAVAESQPHLAAYLAGQTALLIQQLPDLVRLKFESGMPFADAATRRWIQTLEQPRNDTAPSEADNTWDTTLARACDAATQAVAQKGLPTGLALLKQVPAAAGRPAMAKTLAMARLCLDARRPDLAVPMLQALADNADETRLPLWDTSLAIEIWHSLCEALEAGPTNGASDDTERSIRLAALRDRICRTDPEAAARLF